VTAPALPTLPESKHEVRAALNAIYNWNYEPEIDQVRGLYDKAIRSQWIAARDLDWERGIDRVAFGKTFSMAGIPVQQTKFWGTLDPALQWEVSRRTAAFMLSNFLHGEQGAMMVAAQLVDAVPVMDAKFYAATQTMDEARHVEVFATYIKMLDEVYPIMPSLQKLLDATIGHECWMHKAIGMQIVVEGLALYTFRDMRNSTSDPLLKQVLTYVSRDEARHTAYGVKYLSDVVPTLPAATVAELEDFAFEGSRLLIDSRSGGSMRQSAMEIWKQAGLDPVAAFKELVKERDVITANVSQQGGPTGPLRGFVIPTLRAIGLFSERIEGHFREMFGANLGAETAAKLDLHAAFPADLDAWVEQGI
jgi:hypothetical protein